MPEIPDRISFQKAVSMYSRWMSDSCCRSRFVLHFVWESTECHQMLQAHELAKGKGQNETETIPGIPSEGNHISEGKGGEPMTKLQHRPNKYRSSI